ncbi:MAG: phosphotransferase [Anaerolineales bacterium]|nr:phosphotransferase [Anaerolineales bacterium]
MLEKPALADERIRACLETAYGLQGTEISFLPLGADVNTAVYRVVATDGTGYFLKLRQGPFDEMAVRLPHFLSQQGIKAVIPPLPTLTGRLWAELPPFRAILAPFVNGRNGYETRLNAAQWQAFARALRQIHALQIPDEMHDQLRQEEFAPTERQAVRRFLQMGDDTPADDKVARAVRQLFREKAGAILALVERAETLAHALQLAPPPFVLCHSDLHAGNLLIDEHGLLYLVDWDEPLLAPKERDLMYVGGALLASGLTPADEEALFYPGYGATTIHAAARAYYRYERIVADIAAYGRELLLSEAGGADREQSLYYLRSNFEPGHTIAVAYETDSTRGGEGT